jgi:putative Mg2+ transporter-C (MgtC) family protein
VENLVNLIGNLENLEVVFQLLLATVLGGVIGLDRERHEKPAGFRTHMLVTAASAFLIALGGFVEVKYAVTAGAELIRSDPIRIIQTIITGISFLGAGTILRHKKGPVEGLTTAASLFFAATIGIAVGVSAYLLAIAATVLVVAILVVGARIGHMLGVRE